MTRARRLPSVGADRTAWGRTLQQRNARAVPTALLYDALTDDEVFAAIPGLLAESVGGRSTTLGWRAADGEHAVIGHNGYFGDGDFAFYTEHFASDDPWIEAALEPGRNDRAWRLDDLVPPDQLLGTPFFNDWIRGMGDDTFHCVGATFTNRHGSGIIGIHRGRGAGAFGAEEVATIAQDLVHLRRMMTVRARLHAGARELKDARRLLDAVPTQLISVDALGRLVDCNAGGEHVLRAGGVLTVREGKVTAPHADAAALAQAVALATDAATPTASALVLGRGGAGAGPVTLTVVPHRREDGRRVALLMIAPADRLPDAALLIRAHGLTRAEADVALLLAEGLGGKAIAERRGTSYLTVRSQVRQIAGKMGCSTAAQIALAVRRIAAGG